MSKEPVYWTTKDGTKMNVDDMDDNHVRNSFKMVLRNIKTLQERAKQKEINEFMRPRGEMAIDLVEMGMWDENTEQETFDPYWDLGCHPQDGM